MAIEVFSIGGMVTTNQGWTPLAPQPERQPDRPSAAVDQVIQQFQQQKPQRPASQYIDTTKDVGSVIWML